MNEPNCRTSRLRDARASAIRSAAAVVPLFFAGCSTIHSNGYDNYIGPAVARQIALAGRVSPGPRSVSAARVLQASRRPAAPTGPLRLSVSNAIILALRDNPSLLVQTFNPGITETQVQQQRAQFDPTVSGQLSAERSSAPSNGTTSFQTVDAINGQFNVQEFFPTGTTVQAGINTNADSVPFYGDTINSARLGLDVTQSLLQGADINANLAGIREAQLTTRISEYQLRGLAQTLAAQVEETYWNYALAREDIAIVRQALAVARQQLRQTRELVRLGKLAASQLPAVQAQVALEQQALIAAVGAMRTARLNLINDITPPGPRMWNRRIVLLNKPFVPRGPLGSVRDHLLVALRMRPEINESRLEIRRGQLVVVQTRNGLLPKLNFFINLGKTGYANSFGGSLAHVGGDGYDATAGIQGDYPIFNRAANASYRSARLTREQDFAALRNAEQSVELDVQTAYITAETDQHEIAATRATRIAQQAALTAEIAAYRVGSSTSLLVAQAQSNLLTAKIAQVQAVVAYLNALTELYRLDGSLLQRRGIGAPGWRGVKLRRRSQARNAH